MNNVNIFAEVQPQFARFNSVGTTVFPKLDGKVVTQLRSRAIDVAAREEKVVSLLARVEEGSEDIGNLKQIPAVELMQSELDRYIWLKHDALVQSNTAERVKKEESALQSIKNLLGLTLGFLLTDTEMEALVKLPTRFDAMAVENEDTKILNQYRLYMDSAKKADTAAQLLQDSSPSLAISARDRATELRVTALKVLDKV